MFVELASDDQICSSDQRMPSDLNDLHTSGLYHPEVAVQLSQMSVTDISNDDTACTLPPASHPPGAVSDTHTQTHTPI